MEESSLRDALLLSTAQRAKQTDTNLERTHALHNMTHEEIVAELRLLAHRGGRLTKISDRRKKCERSTEHYLAVLRGGYPSVADHQEEDATQMQPPGSERRHCSPRGEEQRGRRATREKREREEEKEEEEEERGRGELQEKDAGARVGRWCALAGFAPEIGFCGSCQKY
jgi:hypothetical protein